MRAFPLRTGLAFLVSVNLLPIANLGAQSAPPGLPVDGATVLTVTFADGGIVNLRGRDDPFATIGIGAGESVFLRFELPARFANTPLVVQALDGGRVVPEDFPVAAAVVSTVFQAGSQPGLYRVLLSGGGHRALLYFWVPDPDNPAANPVVVTPESQEEAP